MSEILSVEELLQKHSGLKIVQDKLGIEPSEEISRTVTSPNVNGIPEEVINFTNDLNTEQGHVTEQGPSTKQKIVGYGGGALAEMGLGFGGTYVASKNATYAKHLNNAVKGIKAVKWGGRAALAGGTAGPQVFEPLTTLGGVAVFAVTEAGTWAAANLVGQSIRKATGVQDAIHGSELIAASLFGIVAKPVESLQVWDKMGKSINKSLPIKFEEGALLSSGAFKGREFIVKGTPRFISGSSLGLAESAIRQELAILMGDQEHRNTYDYLFSAGFGGTFNSAFHVFNRTGAWGRQQATLLSERAMNRTKEALEDLQLELSKIKSSGGTAGQNWTKRKKLEAKIREHQDALDMLDDFKTQIDKQAGLIDNKQLADVGDAPKPTFLLEKEKLFNTRTASFGSLKKEAKRLGIKYVPTDKKIDLVNKINKAQKAKPTEPKVKAQAINNSEADKAIKELNDEWNRFKGTEDYEKMRPTFTLKSRTIYDAADYDTVNAIERLNTNPDDLEAIDLLIEATQIKLKLKDGVLGELNNSSGRSVQQNRADAKPLEPTKYSIATELEIDNLNKLLKDLKNHKKPIDKTVTDNTLRNQKLYNSIYDAVYAEVAGEATATIKVLNAIRTARKLAMVNSVTSAQAAFPTGAFEMARLFVKPLGTLTYETFGKAGKGFNVGGKMAWQELLGGVEAYSFIWNKTNRQQLFKHIKRTFKEGKDPNYRSITKADDDGSSRAIKFGTERDIRRKAKIDATLQAQAQRNLLQKFGTSLKQGKFTDFMSLGARAIMATDAGFKRQLRIAAARTKARQKAILAHPNDTVAAQKYADELYNGWKKDRNGLEVLDGEMELYQDFADIDGALLMTATRSDIEGVEKSWTETLLIDPVDKVLKTDGMGMPIGIAIEAIMPFYKIGVRSVARGTRFTLAPASLLRRTTPYTKAIKKVQSEMRQNRVSINEALRRGDKDIASRKASLQKSLEQRLEMLEIRQMRFNKEKITDAIVGGGLFSTGILLGLSGQITGTNAWMSAEQKKNNPNIKTFKLFGADYRSGVPFNLALSIGADIGNFLRMREEDEEKGTNILAKNKNLVTVIADSMLGTMKELPLNEGVKLTSKLFDGENEYRTELMLDAFTKLASSYIPNPSQVKKIVKQWTSNGELPDLRGASYGERAFYHVLGNGPKNKKLNEFGQPIKSRKGWEFTYNRFAQEENIEPTVFETAKQSDHYGHLPNFPRNFQGLEMNSYIDEDGLTLKTHFGKALQDVEIDGKTLEETVNDFLTGTKYEYQGEKVDWYEVYSLERLSPDGSKDNKGLMVLGSIMRKFYKKTEESLLENEDFLYRFINKDEQSLYDTLYLADAFETDEDGFRETVPPIPIEPYFKDKDKSSGSRYNF